MRVVLYALCECYVWPIFSDYPGFVSMGGSCHRCDTKPEPLNSVIGPEEALEVFKEREGHYPEPIGPNPWFRKILQRK